jgi:acetamidase/formamidase
MKEHYHLMKKPPDYHLSYSTLPDPNFIVAGESVSVNLADAHGFDDKMQQVAGSPNPLAGPFVIQNAHPGQTLAVTIESLYPNRRQGWANKNIHPNLFTSENRRDPYLKEYVQWEVNLENKTASPVDGYFPGRKILLPVDTVLGCIGVAACTDNATASILSGAFGGNMDYPRIRAGTTIYFPIIYEGAYLYIGDGHAIQGAGEITGNGIEISCDIRFNVQIEESEIRFPKGEDKEFLFCIGNSASLEEGIRIATEEMENWLQDRYKLSVDQCGVLMGQLVKYELGNFVSAVYSISCLMPKKVLDQLVK